MNRRRTDANHKSIGATLRGVTVTLDVHVFGAIGCDFIARHVVTKTPEFIEVKDPKQPPSARKLTDNEEAMRAAFPGHWHLVMTDDEALAAVGIRR